MSVLDSYMKECEYSKKYIIGLNFEKYVKLGFTKNNLSYTTYDEIRDWLEDKKNIYISEVYDRNLKIWKYSVMNNDNHEMFSFLGDSNRHNSLANLLNKLVDRL